jgi:protein-L-isoaspartate(D-aspartate) O-methyltransferase
MSATLEGLLDELRGAGLADERVFDALRAVPRTAFVAPELVHRAYENVPLPIGEGQTISQPLMVARMLALLSVKPGDRVLDVGTGSGWHAALLAAMGGEVWSIERRPALARRAKAILGAGGVQHVHLRVGDGADGLPELAPFDAINVAAAAPGGAVPVALEDQLVVGGRLVAPVGGLRQHLVLVRRRSPTVYERHVLERVRFVPLVTHS